MTGAQTAGASPEVAELVVEAREAPELRGLLDSIVQAQAQVARVPHEELEAWARDRADGAAMLVRRLRERSVQATFDGDWVKMGDFYYLQDKGCQRAAAPWGISFDKLDLNTDITREELRDGHVGFVVSAMGVCSQLGTRRTDIGSRSTSSEFWLGEWIAEETPEYRKDQIEADVRKAAVANAYGRIIRAMTGLNGLSGEDLQALGRNPGKVPGVDFKRGARGGARGPKGPATEKQLNFAYRLAVSEGKCSDAPDKAVAKALFQQSKKAGSCYKGVVSDWIEQAKEEEKGFMPWVDFVTGVLGMKDVDPNPVPKAEGEGDGKS